MNLHRVVLNSLFYKLLNKGIYITAPSQTFSFSPTFPFIFFSMRVGHGPYDLLNQTKPEEPKNSLPGATSRRGVQRGGEEEERRKKMW